jgi:hypothetical protein
MKETEDYIFWRVRIPALLLDAPACLSAQTNVSTRHYQRGSLEISYWGDFRLLGQDSM